MQQYLLLAPVLLPLLGGLPVFKMNERIPRRRYVTVLLVLELLVLLVGALLGAPLGIGTVLILMLQARISWPA